MTSDIECIIFRTSITMNDQTPVNTDANQL